VEVGLREYKAASLRIAIAECLPEHMRALVREIVSVQSTNPRKGDATALMWQTCAEADKWWFSLLVHVKPFDDGMSMEQLLHWYAKFGFVKIQDAADDGTPAVLMVRNPQPPKIQLVH